MPQRRKAGLTFFLLASSSRSFCSILWFSSCNVIIKDKKLCLWWHNVTFFVKQKKKRFVQVSDGIALLYQEKHPWLKDVSCPCISSLLNNLHFPYLASSRKGFVFAFLMSVITMLSTVNPLSSPCLFWNKLPLSNTPPPPLSSLSLFTNKW